jgi:uncharacterized RDD family membrane protein YckC
MIKKQNPKKKTPTSNNLLAASFFQLLGVWLYDFMLLCAIWLLAGIVYIIPAQMLTPIDSSKTDNLSTTEFTGPIFYTYLFIISWFFFAWFWTHGGQTLGLRSWSLRLQTKEGFSLNWTQSLVRFLVAGMPWIAALFIYKQTMSQHLIPEPYQYSVFLIGFIGIFWIIIDKEKRSLQDYFSDTCIVKIPKKTKKKEFS